MTINPAFHQDVTDAAGNLLPNVTVLVEREDGGAMPQLYDAEDTDTAGTLGNSYVQADGMVYFHCAAGDYKITLTASGYSPRVLRHVRIASTTEAVVPGHLFGLTLSNNATDATNDIDIASGFATDSTGVVSVTCSAMTKRLDADWSEGTGNGFRYSGAAIANGTYHIYAVWKADGTQDYYADPSATVATVLSHLPAETGGASFVYARRIGSILRASAAIVGFVQLGDEFLRKVPTHDVSVANLGASSVSYPLSVPTGIQVTAIINGYFKNASAGKVLYLRSLDQTDAAAALPYYTAQNAVADVIVPFFKNIRTDTSGQIAARADAASCTLGILTSGWIDTRGRL